MQLTGSIDKTKIFLSKTLENLNSLFFNGCKKLTKPARFNPFSCAGCRIKNQRSTDQYYYTNFCDEWECDLEREMKMKKSNYNTTQVSKQEEDEDACNGSSVKSVVSPLEKKEEIMIEEEKSKKSSHSKRKDHEGGGGGYELAKKMKEMEIMDGGDIEHVLDVEEAIHYYNRLRSPVYLDIVDQFFTDIYKDFSVPQVSSVRTKSSKPRRRFGSRRL